MFVRVRGGITGRKLGVMFKINIKHTPRSDLSGLLSGGGNDVEFSLYRVAFFEVHVTENTCRIFPKQCNFFHFPSGANLINSR